MGKNRGTLCRWPYFSREKLVEARNQESQVKGASAMKLGSRYALGSSWGRFWSMTLSAVLAVTLLQVAPPAKATPFATECAPQSKIAFDGRTLNTIYDFTDVGTCRWSSVPDLTGAQIAIIAGGDGGNATSAGLGGEIFSSALNLSTPTWVDVVIGSGGQGSSDSSTATLGTSSAVYIDTTILSSAPSQTSAEALHAFAGTVEKFGGSSSLEGVSARASSGTGGGKQTISGQAGNGGSGRVIVSIPISPTSVSRYKASDYVAPVDAQIGSEGQPDVEPQAGYWPEFNEPSNAIRRAVVAGSPALTTNPAFFGVLTGTTFDVLQGGPADSIVFPNVITDNYTFISVARYHQKDGGQYKRIFDGVENNWLSGFHDNQSGVAYHGDTAQWLTPVVGHHGFSWVVSTDSANLYRSNGVSRSADLYTAGQRPNKIAINAGDLWSTQSSDFQVADVLIFDRELNSFEYTAVENYLGSAYGICLGALCGPSFSSESTLPTSERNLPYTFQFATSSLDLPETFTYSITGGAIPDGLTLDSAGLLSGSPTAPGAYDFAVTVTDTQTGLTKTSQFYLTVYDLSDPISNRGDRFLQGNYVEVGIAGNGRFGSTGAAPEGFHPRDPPSYFDPGRNRIGFVSDRDRDGWGTGYDDGDFFVPGDPFEGFGLQAGSDWLFNDNYQTEITGRPSVTQVGLDSQSNTWTSDVLPNGEQITQFSSVPTSGQRLDVLVTLTNTSSNTIEDIFYSRQVDPDNSQFIGCGYDTTNTIEAQANTADLMSLASATTGDTCRSDYDAIRDPSRGSYLGLISTDIRSKVGLESVGFFSKAPRIFYEGGEDCSGWRCESVSVAPGFTLTNDSGIGISFHVGDLAAGASTTLAFSYILSPDEAARILLEHNLENAIEVPLLTLSRTGFALDNYEHFSTTTTPEFLSTTGGAPSYFTISPALPAGLIFDSVTGNISGTPSESLTSTIFTISAHNLAGFSSDTFLLSISDFTCEPYDQNSNQGSSQLNVLILNKQVSQATEVNNGTLVTSDVRLAQTLCPSDLLTTTFFDGGDGSGAAWELALDNIDVLVLPETSYSLVGSNLLAVQSVAVLRQWVTNGGRVVITASSTHANSLATLLDMDASAISFAEVEDGSFAYRQWSAQKAMPEKLVVSASDLSNRFLRLDSNFVQSYGGGPVSIYEQDNGSGLSAFTQFSIDRGQVFQISNSYSGETSTSWNKILLQAVYGTPTRFFDGIEHGASWLVGDSELYLGDFNASSQIALGNLWSHQLVTCLNVPSSPAIRKVTTSGTEITCGDYIINDGIVDSGLRVQLKRFFSATSSWSAATVQFTNLDSENMYSKPFIFGGHLGHSSTMRIEATSDRENGSSNLSEIVETGSTAHPRWIITSRGANVLREFGDHNAPVVIQVFGEESNTSYGGSNRDLSDQLDEDEIYSEFDLVLTPNATETFSFFTGAVRFAAGCDRMAVDLAKVAAQSLNEEFSPFNNGWLPANRVSLPNLSTSTCSSFQGSLERLSVVQDSGDVVATWPQVANASSYEIIHKVVGAQNWSTPVDVAASGNAIERYVFSSLLVGTEYEFRVRPIQTIRNASGDRADGTWSVSTQILLTPTQSVTPQPIVRKAQVLPKVPKVMKVKKTIKFTMKTKAGLALAITSKGACKTTKITAKKKVGKKTTTTQTGWLVTATKKGNCTVTFKAKGNTKWLPLKVSKVVKIS